MSELHVVKGKRKRRAIKPISIEEVSTDQWEGADGTPLDSQHALISLMLPSAVKAFYAELESEVETLCGKRYSRGTSAQRWTSQAGSIQLGNQSVAIKKARVRDTSVNQEVPLQTYARFITK